MSAEPHLESYDESYRETPGSYWPEKTQSEAYDMVIKFGEFALEADSIAQAGTFENSNLVEELAKVRQESLCIGSLLLEKIPLHQIREFESRQEQVKQDAQVIDMRQDRIEPSPNTSRYPISDRLIKYFKENMGKQLTYEDIVLAIYPEEIAKGEDIRNLRQRVSGYLTPSNGQRRLQESGIKIDKVPIKTKDRKVRLAVVPYNAADSLYKRAGGKDEHWVENAIETSKDEEKRRMLFRSSAERMFVRVPKVLPEYHRPQEGQTFVIGKNPEILENLLMRGIITPEQFIAKEIDRSAVVALLIINKGEDNGFLEGKMTALGMEIIRNEEIRYFERLRSAEDGGKKKTGRPPQD